METGRNLSYRIASIQEAGKVPNYEASMAKVYFSEQYARWTAASSWGRRAINS